MAGAFIFSTIRYAGLLQVRARLASELTETKRQQGILEGQLKQDEEHIASLNEEKALLLGSLKETQEKVLKANQKNAQNEERIFSLVKELDILQKEKVSLEEKITNAAAQNAALNERLHSIPELKKAIRELKIQMRNSRLSFKPHLKPRQEITEGNAGYIIKDGIPTYRQRIKIEVKPAE